MTARGDRSVLHGLSGPALILVLAVSPGLAAGQARPDQSPPRSGDSSSDVDTARAAIGVLGLLAKKAREAEAKKKEEAARKKREEEAAAARQREVEAEAAEAPGPALEPGPTLSGTVARTPTPTVAPTARPERPRPAARPSAEPVRRAPPPAAIAAPPPPPPPVVAPPPIAAPVAAVPAPQPAPAPVTATPSMPAPPGAKTGLGLAWLAVLAVLAAVAFAAARAFGLFAPPPRARARVDPGDPSAPEFTPALKGPAPSLQISQGVFVSEATYPEPAV